MGEPLFAWMPAKASYQQEAPLPPQELGLQAIPRSWLQRQLQSKDCHRSHKDHASLIGLQCSTQE
jgi:hypothetical protein